MKLLTRFSLIPGAFLLAIAAAIGGGIATHGGVAEAAYPAADNITMTQVCASDGTIDLTINWLTYNQGYQWVDMSSGVSFAPGTYNSSMQLVPNQNSYVWHGVGASMPYYLRVNTQTAGGWYASPVMYFTTQACNYNNAYGSSYSSMSYAQPSYAYQPMYATSYPVVVRIVRVPVLVHPVHRQHHMTMHHHK